MWKFPEVPCSRGTDAYVCVYVLNDTDFMNLSRDIGDHSLENSQ